MLLYRAHFTIDSLAPKSHSWVVFLLSMSTPVEFLNGAIMPRVAIETLYRKKTSGMKNQE